MASPICWSAYLHTFHVYSKRITIYYGHTELGAGYYNKKLNMYMMVICPCHYKFCFLFHV